MEWSHHQTTNCSNVKVCPKVQLTDYQSIKFQIYPEGLNQRSLRFLLDLRWPFRSWDENFTEILKNHHYTASAF